MILVNRSRLKEILNKNKLWKNKKGVEVIDKEVEDYLNLILSNARIVQDSWNSSKANFKIFKPEALIEAKKKYIQKEAENIIKDYILLVAERLKTGVDDFGTNTNQRKN